ncbi:MAG: LysM peptidoglycan-binding domain-containing protein [Pseudomonadota bacterium]
MKNLSILILILLVSCSGAKKQHKNETSVMDSSNNEILLVEDDALPNTSESAKEDFPVAAQSADENTPSLAETAPLAQEKESSRPSLESSGKYAYYEVKQGETLMLIAFKIYGDYRYWKELSSLNKNLNNNLSAGRKIKYQVPAEEFSWNPKGEPYLLKRGDTLQKVSFHAYNTNRKWKSIWENNRPMIRDPQLVFAGFTVYYIPLQETQQLAKN